MHIYCFFSSQRCKERTAEIRNYSETTDPLFRIWASGSQVWLWCEGREEKRIRHQKMGNHCLNCSICNFLHLNNRSCFSPFLQRKKQTGRLGNGRFSKRTKSIWKWLGFSSAWARTSSKRARTSSVVIEMKLNLY